MNPIISIIIPVYNTELYIERCLESILTQTFTNFEIICINDGSTDKTLEKIEKIKDKRIRIYTQKNQGPAIARNNGIKKAKGQFIMFIDSDDFIDNNYLMAYYQANKKGEFDIVMGGYVKQTGNKITFTRKLTNGIFAKYLTMAPYCKLYKTSFITRHKLKFLDTTASEDIYFNTLAYSKKPKIKTIDNISYHYYFNENSISNTQHKGFNKKIDLPEFLDKININSIDNKALHQYFIIRYIIWYLLYSGRTASSQNFMKEYHKLFNWLTKNIPNYSKNHYLKHFPKGDQKSIYYIIKIFMILHQLRLINLFAKIYCKGDIV